MNDKWKRKVTERHGQLRVYYKNLTTGVSQWEKPDSYIDNPPKKIDPAAPSSREFTLSGLIIILILPMVLARCEKWRITI